MLLVRQNAAKLIIVVDNWKKVNFCRLSLSLFCNGYRFMSYDLSIVSTFSWKIKLKIGKYWAMYSVKSIDKDVFLMVIFIKLCSLLYLINYRNSVVHSVNNSYFNS